MSLKYEPASEPLHVTHALAHSQGELLVVLRDEWAAGPDAVAYLLLILLYYSQAYS